MTVINTNVSATLASNAIVRNERAMSTAMERLATGRRINSASDDAAGLAIASRMSSQVKGLEQAARNANDAISMTQTVEGAGKEILNILTRMKELAVQAGSGTYSDTDRDAMDLEYQQLEAEILRIETNTKWNGQALLDGADTVAVQIGAGSGQTMSLSFGDWTTTGNGGVFSVQLSSYDLQSTSNAATAMTNLDTAITKASEELAKYGSYTNRLEYAADNLSNIAANTDASRSRIEDADYAKETSELAKTQIIAQAGTAMLAQANQIKQTVLALLQ